MNMNKSDKEIVNGIPEINICSWNKSDCSKELLETFSIESLSRKWKSRCDLLDVVLERIKSKDCTLYDLEQMIRQNYNWNSLHQAIKESAWQVRWKKWRKEIKNLQELKNELFSFDITDDQFCNFLWCSNKWNYDLSNSKIEVSFWSQYEDLIKEKKEIEQQMEEKKIELEHQYQSELSRTGISDNRRLPEGHEYNVDQNKKENFINDWILSFCKKIQSIWQELSKIESEFYAKYPYLKSEKAQYR